MKLFDFFIYSSLFIAVCCVVMCIQTWLLFPVPVNDNYLVFAASGTLCSYNFHWYFSASLTGSKRAIWTREHRQVHIYLFITGLSGAAYAFFRLWDHAEWLFSAAVITFLYSAPLLPFRPFRLLQKIAVAKTTFLALVWTHITVILPLLISGSGWTTGEYVFVINRFFFIFSICILFDYRDRVTDSRAGIRSLVTQLSEKGVDVLFWCTQAVVLMTSGLLAAWLSYPLAFILLMPSLALGVWYRRFKASSSDLIYYFILDGMMMVSGLLIILIFILTKFES